MNQWAGLGRLTAEPELRQTQSGKSVVNATLAVDRGFGDNKTTDFIPIVAWNGLAELIAKHCGKGSKIAVTGVLQTRTYTDKDGNNRKAFEILLNGFDFAGDKLSAQTEKAPQNQSQSVLEDYYGGFEEMDDLDVPF